MPSKKKKYNARFPPARIKKIMQSDEEVGKVAQAVPVIISRALELFVESLLKRAEVVTNARNAKTLTPSHLKQCILAEHRFDFLKELVATVPDVQGEEELAETPRSSSSNNPFIFPPPSSTATSSNIPSHGSSAEESGEPRQSSVSYINDPNLVSYHIPPTMPSMYHNNESAIVSPHSTILNPVGANSNPYIPVIQHNPAASMSPLLPPPTTQVQYHVQSNVQMTPPPQNGYNTTESILSLSSVPPGMMASSRNNSNASSGVILYDKESHKGLQDHHSE